MQLTPAEMHIFPPKTLLEETSVLVFVCTLPQAVIQITVEELFNSMGPESLRVIEAELKRRKKARPW